jgi:F-type H+-transporting ATPase subunit epsilon
MVMQVELVSPERILFSGDAEMVVARTTDGDIAFLTGHAPFIGALVEGAVLIRTTEGRDEHAAVHGGFVEVSDNRVTILSDLAEMADQIDEARARARIEELERHTMEQDDGIVEAMLRRDHVRLEVVSRTR